MSTSTNIPLQKKILKKFFITEAYHSPPQLLSSTNLLSSRFQHQRIHSECNKSYEHSGNVFNPHPHNQNDWTQLLRALDTNTGDRRRNGATRDCDVMWCSARTSVVTVFALLMLDYSSPDPVPRLSRRDLGDWRGDRFGDRLRSLRVSLGSQS